MYSDGWCEQGGIALDNTSSSTTDTLTYLPIPFADNLYQLNITHYTGFTNSLVEAQSIIWVDGGEGKQTYKSFYMHIGPDRTAYANISYAGMYIARGYVSQETFKQVLAGKGWNPIDETWV